MDWILEIIARFTADDGTFDQEAANAAIKAEAPKHVVPKHKFNDLSNRLKEATDKLENIKPADNSEIEAQLNELAEAYESQTLFYAKRDALIEAGASQEDLDFLMWKLGDDFELSDEGEVTGITEAVDGLKETSAKYFSADEVYGDDGEGTDAEEDKTPDQKWAPLDNKLDSGNPPSDKEPANLLEAITAHYSKPAD